MWTLVLGWKQLKRTGIGKGESMFNSFAIATLATAILISPVKAQTRGAVDGTKEIGIASHLRQGQSFARRSGPLPYYPYPYHDYDYGYDSEQASQPQVVVAPPLSALAAPVAAPVEPLLIEWQGDHYVRMTLSQKASAGEESGPDYSVRNASGQKDAVRPLRELPPAVLVFRDGRKKEVSGYTIISGTIYSNADYGSNGSWTKKIQIADLDVPATLKLNQERGLKFALPAGPNEVIMRP
jgi:hypothetical protein